MSLATLVLGPSGKGAQLTFTEPGVFLDGHDEAVGREEGTRGLSKASPTSCSADSARAVVGFARPRSSCIQEPKSRGGTAMRFMLLLKASKASEAGEMPSEELIREMGVFNEGLIQSGVLVDCAGLQASAKGARVKLQGAKRTVTEGPFDPEQLVSGFWMIQVKSKAEAIEWAKRCPHPHPGEDAEIEIRQVFETEDFENAPPEVVEQEKKFRARAKRSK